MHTPFFPTLVFAALFAVVLMGGMIWASWWDYTTMKVPKKVTMSLLAAGVVMNVARGVWLGSIGITTWYFEAGPVLGGLDGFLFSLSGLLIGFTLFTVMWIMGVAGGGDVKLATALGAWVGPKYLFFVLLTGLPVVMVLTLLKIGAAVTVGKPATAGGPNMGGGKRILSYSLPLTIAVAIMLAVAFSGAKF